MGNVDAKQHQLGQRRDVDRTHSLKRRPRKNALINSAHDAQELMRRVTRALLSMCRVSPGCVTQYVSQPWRLCRY